MFNVIALISAVMIVYGIVDVVRDANDYSEDWRVYAIRRNMEDIKRGRE